MFDKKSYKRSNSFPWTASEIMHNPFLSTPTFLRHPEDKINHREVKTHSLHKYFFTLIVVSFYAPKLILQYITKGNLFYVMKKETIEICLCLECIT